MVRCYLCLLNTVVYTQNEGGYSLVKTSPMNDPRELKIRLRHMDLSHSVRCPTPESEVMTGESLCPVFRSGDLESWLTEVFNPKGTEGETQTN